MRIEIEQKNGAAVVRLDGELDFNTCVGFTDKIVGLFDQSPEKLVVDMTSVSHIDSMGLGAITRLWKDAEKTSCAFVLAGVQKNVGKLISLINLDNRIKIFEDVDSALQ